MATLSTTRNYDDGQVLTKADLDAFLDDIESFLNSTKINDDNIQNSGITGSTKLLNQSVTAAKLASDSVETAKIAASAVTTAKIADSAVTTGKINDLAVTTAKLAADAVTTAKILDANVTTAKIADDAVTTVKILDSNVTTAKISDLAVTTAKINDGAVTGAKLAATYGAATITRTNSSTSGTVTASDDIVTITTTGRPIALIFTEGTITGTSSNVGNSGYIRVERVVSGTPTTLYTLINVTYPNTETVTFTPVAPGIIIDTSPGSQSTTYRIYYSSTRSAATMTVSTSGVKVLAFEI